MVYIIHGATGAQGAPVLSALSSSGHTAVAAVRDVARVPRGVTSIAVALDDVDGLTAAYEGSEGIFVHLPMGPPDVAGAQARAISAAISAARPERVVISTSGQIVDQPGSALQAPDESPIMTLIRNATDSGVSTAVVAPRLYLENLLLPVVAGPASAEGVLRYPLPENFPVSWSSHLDVAEVVVRLLTEPAITGTVGVGHLPGLTGHDLATAFAAGLGRDVRYEGITAEAFGELITPMFGPAAAPVVALYRALGTQAHNTIGSASSAQEVLGLFPRPVSQWLAETVA